MQIRRSLSNLAENPRILAVDSKIKPPFLHFWRREARLLDEDLQRNITKAALRLGRAKDATQAGMAGFISWGDSVVNIGRTLWHCGKSPFFMGK